MDQPSELKMTKKDYLFGIASGLLIGLLMLPILKAAKPELYAKFALIVLPFFLIGTPIGLFIANLIGRKIRVIWQIGKFGVIGILNTLVDLGSLALITFLFRAYFHIDSKDSLFMLGASVVTFYSLYKAITFIIANVNSYYWNKYWTFNPNPETKSHAQFIQFFAVSVIGFIINVLVASLVFKVIGAAAGLTTDQIGLLGGAAGSIVGLVWNFIGYKFIVFKEQTA
jgi:putative flippase GtrA